MRLARYRYGDWRGWRKPRQSLRKSELRPNKPKVSKIGGCEGKKVIYIALEGRSIVKSE